MWRLLGNGDITVRVKQGLRQDYGNGEVKGNGKVTVRVRLGRCFTQQDTKMTVCLGWCDEKLNNRSKRLWERLTKGWASHLSDIDYTPRPCGKTLR